MRQRIKLIALFAVFALLFSASFIFVKNLVYADTALSVTSTPDRADDIHSQLATLKNIKGRISLPEVTADGLNTYGDAIGILKSLQAALDQIKTNSDVKSQLTASLNTEEAASLEKNLGKYKNDFSRLNAVIFELDSYIQELIDMLTPIANKPISGALSIKKILIAEINGFKSQISGVAEIEDNDVLAVDADVN